MALFDKKTVYHSKFHLCVGKRVMFTNGPQESQYPGKPSYIPFKVEFEDGDHYLNIENDSILKALETVPVDQWLMLNDVSGRDETASISLTMDDTGAVGGEDAPAPTKPAKQSPKKPASNGRSNVPKARSYRATTLIEDMQEALLASAKLQDWFKSLVGRDMTAVDKEVATTLFIEFNKKSGQTAIDKASEADRVAISKKLEGVELIPEVCAAIEARVEFMQPAEAVRAIEWLATLKKKKKVKEPEPEDGGDDSEDEPVEDDLPF